MFYTLIASRRTTKYSNFQNLDNTVIQGELVKGIDKMQIWHTEIAHIDLQRKNIIILMQLLLT